MRAYRLPAALAACVAALLALPPRPCAAQAVEPRFVVFESFLRPT